MKLSRIITINAFLFVALGIGFTLFAPNLLAYFGVSELPGEDILLYWNIVAFARMFGATVMTIGLVLWAIRGIFESANDLAQTRRELIFALVLGLLFISITALTQQSSVWGSITGWVITAIFVTFMLIYVLALVRKEAN